MKRVIKGRVSGVSFSTRDGHEAMIVAKSARIMPWALRVKVKPSEIAKIVGAEVTITVETKP